MVRFLKTIDDMEMLGSDESTIDMQKQHLMKYMPTLEEFGNICISHSNQDGVLTRGVWEIEFLNQHTDSILPLFECSDYFNFEELFEAIQDYCVYIIRTSTPDTVRKIFGCCDDLSPVQKSFITKKLQLYHIQTV